MTEGLLTLSWLTFAGVALAHLLAAISPGPSFVLSVRTAANEGLRPATCLALGFGIGATLWAAGALAGLKLLFEIVPWFFTALKVGGGLFLVFIAWRMWQHAPDPMPAIRAGTAPRSGPKAVRLGVGAMLANPKPAIFFGGVFVGLVPPQATIVDLSFILFNILWMESLWYMFTALVFSRPRARQAYGRFKTVLDRIFGTILAGLGVTIAAT